ncbi:MAG: queuosine salvage family protein [Solirubrobacteraceae bacterium]
MNDPLTKLRCACAEVARRARYVTIDRQAIGPYAAELSPAGGARDPEFHLVGRTREELAALWLTLDAINFGSGWFPTLRKGQDRSGYFTIAAGVRKRFEAHGPWAAHQLAAIDAAELAAVLGQAPGHELMGLFARSLRDLGAHITQHYDGRFGAVVDRASGSAATFVTTLARWRCFEDTSEYEGIAVPFLKRAQIAAADLSLAGVARFSDLGRLTMFADNLVPHVLRLDGILVYAPALVKRIERGELIEHGSPEEVEIRGCAVHAVELIVAARGGGITAAAIDRLLWNRGQQARYKARPRHRTRCTAY